jgi:carboxyl-terminal processing protease
LLAGAAFAGGAWCAEAARATTDAQSPYDVLRQLARVLVLVENEYVEPVERSRLAEGAIKGLVAELDPHSAYLPPRAYDTFQGDTDGEFGGVGIEVDFRGAEVTVIATIEGSPAAAAGVVAGDRIVAIDRISVQGKSATELVQRMRGPEGSDVTVGIRREGNEKIINFTLTRRIISVASIAVESLVDQIAYIRVKQFQRGTHTELLEGIAEVRRRLGGDIRGLILDLRNNPGGLVKEAIAVADEFLEGGNIYSTRRRGKIVDSVDATRGGALTAQPMVALVNQYSASAAELVAGALRDQSRATVVGAPTFGKGSVQTIIDLPGNAGLRLTTMRYYTPKGLAIQARGVQPDVLVEAAYVEDDSFGVRRESDLENHLAPEGPAVEPTKDEQTQPGGPIEEHPGISPTHLGVIRKVPEDPTGGPDFALSIGFQIVRGVLSTHR